MLASLGNWSRTYALLRNVWDSPELRHCRKRLELPPEELNPRPLVTGDDLIAHGMEPGKSFRPLLDAVRDAQLDKEIHTRDQALALVERLIEEAGQG